jgi:hypothetical protein
MDDKPVTYISQVCSCAHGDQSEKSLQQADAVPSREGLIIACVIVNLVGAMSAAYVKVNGLQRSKRLSESRPQYR